MYYRRNLAAALLCAALVLLFTVFAHANYGGLKGYAGSDACGECHEDVYKQWRRTPHSKMLVDAKKDPAAILATEFTDAIPFTTDDIVFTVGNHWVQKYITEIDGTLYVLPKYWNVPKRAWEPYSIWNWRQEPYNVHCDGCHTVGFDPETETFFEPGIGCESCHGPGEKHVESDGDPGLIVNPLNLDRTTAQMICMACHTDGTDTTYNKYPFPVGYVPGDDLSKYSSDFFMPKPKSKKWYWGTMDTMERKRMYYFFQSKFYSTNRACEVCGFDRGATESKERYMSRSEYCGTCHKDRWENLEKHSGHTEEQAGCTDCHNPQVVDEWGTYSIHDHRFDFSKPKMPCSECHDEEDPEDFAVEAIAEDGKVTWAPEPEHHDFHFKPVDNIKPLSEEEACLSCHKEEDKEWAKKAIPEKIVVEGRIAD